MAFGWTERLGHPEQCLMISLEPACHSKRDWMRAGRGVPYSGGQNFVEGV